MAHFLLKFKVQSSKFKQCVILGLTRDPGYNNKARAIGATYLPGPRLGGRGDTFLLFVCHPGLDPGSRYNINLFANANTEQNAI
jgi:hypothetical protein